MKENNVLPDRLPQNSIFFEVSLYGLIAFVSVIMMAAAFSNAYAAVLAAGGSVFLLGAYALYIYNRNRQIPIVTPGQMAGVLVFAGILVRLVLAAGIYGYVSDVECFTGWSYFAYNGGLDHFYTSGFFADYPPLYMYVLYFLGLLQDVFAISANVFLIKLPAIVGDILLAFVLYKAAQKRLNRTQAIFVFMCILLNGALIVNSAAWGQIDVLFVLLALICVYFLMIKKYTLSVVFFILTLLLKVQAVLLAPLFIFVFARGIFVKKSRQETLVGFLVGLAVGVGVGLLLILPFTGGRPLSWIFDLYLNSLGGYSYVSVNAFNLYGLLGLNWMPLETTFLGVPFNIWGIIGVAAVCGYGAFLYRMDSRGGNLFNISAFITLGVYMFASSMHERYSFAAPVFLLTAYVLLKNRKLFYAFLLTSGTVLINECVALAYYNLLIPYEIMAWISVFNIIAFVYTVIVVTRSSLNYHNNEGKRLVANEKEKMSAHAAA